MTAAHDPTPPTPRPPTPRPIRSRSSPFALKRTLEDAYGFVRLRGELSKVTHHANGHVYLTLKDEQGLPSTAWSGRARSGGCRVRPEQGLEVIVTGKITTYPAGSRYQIVIETMEAAGVGALLAQLERPEGEAGGRGPVRAAAQAPPCPPCRRWSA